MGGREPRLAKGFDEERPPASVAFVAISGILRPLPARAHQVECVAHIRHLAGPFAAGQSQLKHALFQLWRAEQRARRIECNRGNHP